MIATICVLLPSLLVYIIKDRYEHVQGRISERVLRYGAYTLSTNALMLFVLYVGFGRYTQIFERLNESHRFACKYFALSVVFALVIALCDHMSLKRPTLRERFKSIIPYVCLFYVFVVLCVFMDRNVDSILDSDMASEMVRANLLSEGKAILSESWYYSTELRVLNTQLIFTPLFWLFNDWHTIRLVGSVLCWLVLLVSYYYLCRQLGLKKYFAVSAICLLLPLSCNYFSFTITGLYYIPHIAITFFTFGLLFQYSKCEGKYPKILLAVLCLLSIGAGMGGLRQLAILYIPLVLTDAVLFLSIRLKRMRPETRRTRRFFTASLVASLFSVAGYLINSCILSEIYTYRNWETIQYQDISLDSLMKVINGILSFFGFQTGDVFSFASISNIFCCFLLVLLAVILFRGIAVRHCSEEYYICSLFYLISIVVFALLYTVTSMSYNHRYNIPVLTFALPLVVLGLKESHWQVSCQKWVSGILAAGMVLCCGCNYLSYLDGSAYYNFSRNGAEYSTVADFLVSEGYKEGYATFWNANILTELSDGEIDVRDWGDSAEVRSIDQIYEWLQLKSHASTVPEGSVFVLLRTNQLEKIDFYPSLNEENIIYQSDAFIIYGYECYENLTADIEDGPVAEE
ncbi:MAG: hypothetical protein LIO45_01890 [Clostridiales bacterium]|nr:hypothetical protein [Clostridiales bacterium]